MNKARLFPLQACLRWLLCTLSLLSPAVLAGQEELDQLHIFRVCPGNVAELIENPAFGKVQLWFRLTEKGKEAFRMFTRHRHGQRMTVLAGDEVLLVATTSAVIDSGQLSSAPLAPDVATKMVESFHSASSHSDCTVDYAPADSAEPAR